MFLTTHYLEEAQQLSDRIGILNAGKVVATGAPDALIAQFGRPERIRITGDPSIADKLRPMGLPISQSADSVEVEMRSKDDAVPVLQTVASSGLRWESFSTVNDSLEDVFIKLVGRVEENGVRATDGEEVAS